MGNKILGKRSRNFYRGFNQRQLSYLRDKFETFSEGGALKKQLFCAAYQIDEKIFEAFIAQANFDEQGGVDEYEFICMVSFICNLTMEELGKTFFGMICDKKGNPIKEQQLLPFTRVCLRYNAYVTGGEVKDADIKKSNRDKFKKYDYDKNKSIDCAEFCSICLKDGDYKDWLFNMGFITKNQMDHQDQIYDLVDSDIGEQVERQLRDNNPNVDRIKRGLENRQGDDQFKPQIEIGQQSAVAKEKPWLMGLNNLKAGEYADQSVKQLAEGTPSQYLSLEYVLGYRSFDCRNNLRFDSKDQIIYHQAALGIVLSPTKKQGGAEFDQIFLNEHKDDITCLDNAGDKVVTGQAGTSPMIVIWNTKKVDNGALKSEFIITKCLKDSVGSVCLSPSQKLIAATCNDQDHSLVVYDLQQLKQNQSNLTSTKTGIICAGPLVKCLVFDIKFQQDEQSLVAATIRELLFISIDKGVINSSRGDFGQFSSTMALCLQPMTISGGKGPKKYQMVTGMGNGSIYFWQKGKCVKALVGHSGSVSVLTKRADCNSIISGDKTGKIIFWNDSFAKQRELNVAKTNSPSNMIVSLSHGSKKQLLIGTKGSNVFLLNNGDPIEKAVTVASGHSDGVIWTAAIGDKFLYTGGEDQRLIKWDFRGSKKAVKEVKCINKIRSMDYNGKSKLLAVGFTNGQIMFFKADTLDKVQNLTFNKIKNPDQQTLNIVRFQSYGRFIMVSYLCPKPKIVFLSCDKQLKVLGQLQLKYKAIAFDLSKTDKQPFFLRCNQVSPQGEIYEVYEITTEKDKIRSKLVNQKIVKAEWPTHTCPFAPQTRSIISDGIEEKDITCVARSLRYRNVIVAGDRFSKLKLFNYPCPFNKIYNKYDAHSNAVTAIIFSPEEDYLISIGGEQKAIFIWKYEPELVKNPYVVDSLTDQFQKQEEIGVQSMAVSQFKGQIFAPRDFVPNSRKQNQVPKEDAKVKHAFGVRTTYLSDEVRNQCRLTLDCQDILFPTACMAIKMNIETRKQDIFLEHKEDIVSFAVDRERKLMATGQMAQRNLKEPLKKILSIYVWDIQNKKSLVKLDGFHTIAVVLLQFSPSGKLLFSCGNDEKNSFAVYDWRAKTILYSGPVSRAKVNGIVWRSQTQFATCGNDHVKFWQNGKGRLGQFAPTKTEAQFSITSSGNVYISGGGNGNLFVWNGNKGPASLKAHTKKVQCLVDRKNFVYSGGDDGKILRWKKKTNGSIQNSDLCLDTRAAFPQRKMGKQMQYGVLSLDFGPENDETFLFLTQGASIVVSQRGKCKLVTQGHCSGQLWGLATSCTQDLLVTGGDDASVRMWSIQNREEVGRANFQRNIRAVDWSPKGDRIICADAKVNISLLDKNLNQLSVYSGEPAKNNKNGKGWVQQIKFSPNSQLVAYGTHGNSKLMQLLKVEGKNISAFKCFQSGLTSATLHIDWSRDSSSISVNSRAAELLFFSVASITKKGNNVSASSFREEKWATFTQKFGFPVQGIFQGPSYEDIHTVCRDPTGKFLAVGYNDQTIRLFKYPCYIPKQVNKTYYGHSSHVTKVRFTPNYMVSIGGLDRTIIIWDLDRGQQYQKEVKQGESQDELSDLDDEVDLPRKVMTNRKKKKKVEEQFRQIEASGDEFMAVKPWLGAIKEPTYPFPKQTPNPPKAEIKLQYVHGYRTKDCRQNLYFNDQKKLIYHAAAVLIYHDTKDNSQQLLTDHTDDILSIDYHKPSGGVVTGQLGPKPLVNYYKDAKLVYTFKSPVTKGVLALAISPDGSKAVATGMDDDHMVAVLDLKKGTVIAKQKGGKKVILKAGWISDEEFVTVGIRHFKYWTLDGAKIKAKDGKQPGNFVSLAINKDKILTGASAGTIYTWNKNSSQLAVKLKRPLFERAEDAQQEQLLTRVSVVQSISIQKGFIAAGTKDGYIFILSQRFETLNCYALNQVLTSFGLVSQHPAVRSIDFLNDKMLIGTFGSEIFQLKADKISAKNTKIQGAVCHVKAHYSPNNTWTNQVWGLYVDGDLAFSCSDDATVRCWGIQERKLYSIASLNLVKNAKNQWQQSAKDDKTNDFYDSSKGRSVCLSPDKKFVVVGCKEGTVRIFRFSQKNYSMQMHQVFRHAQEWISQIKFGFNLLIIGSHDNGIYVYDYDPQAESFKRKYKPMKKHSSYITHVDVSRDSCYLQSTCGAYELLFWDLNTGRQITSGATMLRDERWATWTCTLGWPVQGIYPKCTDGTFIHSVDRSHSSMKGTITVDKPPTPYLLAGGNNNGEICIYSFPCTIKNSSYVPGIGHSSHVTNVRWTNNDDRIISVGGQDQCVMYWQVRKNT